jgi:hypothetical protein
MNFRSLVFLCIALLLASFVQGRLGEDDASDKNSGTIFGVEEAQAEHNVRQLGNIGYGNFGGASRYADWPSRCCGQNNNAGCLCPVRNVALFADKWAAKCAERNN